MVHKGQTYRTRRDIEVTAMTSWAAPVSGGQKVILAAGELFKISNDPPETATAVYCAPVNAEEYQRMEVMFVHPEERTADLYTGFYLCLYIEDIEKSCDLQSL